MHFVGQLSFSYFGFQFLSVFYFVLRIARIVNLPCFLGVVRGGKSVTVNLPIWRIFGFMSRIALIVNLLLGLSCRFVCGGCMLVTLNLLNLLCIILLGYFYFCR
jgi:hypothetical protein